MGDVYKAMQKARQQSGERAADPVGEAGVAPAPDEGVRTAEPGASEVGGLPMDQIQASPLVDDRIAAGKDGLALDEDDELIVESAPPVEGSEVGAAAGSQSVPAADREAATASVPGSDSGKMDSTVSRAMSRVPTAKPGKRIQGAHRDRKYHGSLNGYSREVVAHHDRGSVITEQYRAIRTQILARGRTRKLHTHTITSSLPGEGKTVTTLNLGVTFAELTDQNTLIIEADLRCPAFAKLLDRDGKPGLLDYLEGRTDDIDEIIQRTVYDNFQFIPAGGSAADRSTQLLSSPRMLRLLDRLKDRYDHLFIDTPPIISVTDACIMGAASDQVMLVVQLNRTTSEAVERAKRLLKAGHCEVSGVILTHQTEHHEDYYTSKYSRYYRPAE
ncbi:MAG: CpsD/CapB family tyrosine-protein kinase [Phycisphaeraceae bacterium]|nr:CpsD/CapB family tyrosine-protein kinase [Phycisphaeraceae bacterium]